MATDPAVLERDQITDVFRYWLAMIRREEALSLRIRAEPPIPVDNARAVNLIEPGRGRTYFKLVGETALSFITRDARKLELELTGDRTGFFEHWLTQTYRQQRFRRGNEDHEPPPVVIGFPVVYDARRGELKTLLRFTAEHVTWLDAEGDAWEAPEPRDRRKGRVPAGPVKLRLEAESPGGEMPFMLDDIVLSRTLGIPEEVVGRFIHKLQAMDDVTPEQVMRWVLALLHGADKAAEGGLPEEIAAQGNDTDLLVQLADAARGCLVASGVQVWPIGLAYDGATGWATHYLRQDLGDLISGDASWRTMTPLGEYMSGKVRRTAHRGHVGRRADRILTADQRLTAQRFLGSRLTAAQGPPGTGKTELILALCAHTVIERMAGCTTGEKPKVSTAPLLVVCSTKNRAVDNVLDVLSTDLADDRLPIGLRLGSRPVMTEVTVPMLQRTVRWLERSNSKAARAVFHEGQGRLEAATAAVRKAEEDVRKAEDSIRDVEAGEARCTYLRGEIDTVRERLDELGAAAEGAAERKVAHDRARTAFDKLRTTLVKQITKITKATQAQKHFVARKSWRSVAGTKFALLNKQLVPLGLSLALPEPPEEDDAAVEAELTAWLTAYDALTDEIDELENSLDEIRDVLKAIPDLEELLEQLPDAEEELARRRKVRVDPADARQALTAVVAEHEAGLFETAQAVREAWAALNRDQLLKSVRRVQEALQKQPSLRSAERRFGTEFDDLRRLFPVMGCTLLSMGNGFPMAANVIERVVIDEAGQCHPAHAVSALFRARRALVIGDVHQLEPVIEIDDVEEARVLRRLGRNLDETQLAPYRVTATAEASAQRLAERATRDVPCLRDHFRCQAPIIAISDKLCHYDLTVRTAPNSLASRSALLATGPLIGLDVRGQQVAMLGSWANPEEVRRVTAMVGELVREGIQPHRIAVLTPYRGQLRALYQGLRAAGIPQEEPERAEPISDQAQLFSMSKPRGVALGTVHRFQGGERDVVILSTVVSRPRSLAFTNSRLNLVNVAVSRARLHLVVVGNRELLGRGAVTSVLVNAVPAEAWR